MKFNAFGLTDTGLQRSNNEDSFFLDEQLGLFMVADGMGGHAAGEVASRMALDEVWKHLQPQLATTASAEELQAELATAIQTANKAIRQASGDNPTWSGMGTTLTMLLLHSQQALLAHVGDSRLYRWRHNRLEQLSEDQTLIAEQLRRGIINQQEARHSNLNNILLQAVGTAEELDIFQKSSAVQAADSFLLCSDGLTGMLSDAELEAILATTSQPAQACEKLIDAALDAGGRDNVTAVLVTAHLNEKSQQSNGGTDVKD